VCVCVYVLLRLRPEVLLYQDKCMCVFVYFVCIFFVPFN